MVTGQSLVILVAASLGAATSRTQGFASSVRDVVTVMAPILEALGSELGPTETSEQLCKLEIFSERLALEWVRQFRENRRRYPPAGTLPDTIRAISLEVFGKPMPSTLTISAIRAERDRGLAKLLETTANDLLKVAAHIRQEEP